MPTPPSPSTTQATNNTRALLQSLEELRDSLSARVDHLAVSVRRLREETSNLARALGGSEESGEEGTVTVTSSDRAGLSLQSFTSGGGEHEQMSTDSTSDIATEISNLTRPITTSQINHLLERASQSLRAISVDDLRQSDIPGTLESLQRVRASLQNRMEDLASYADMHRTIVQRNQQERNRERARLLESRRQGVGGGAGGGSGLDRDEEARQRLLAISGEHQKRVSGGNIERTRKSRVPVQRVKRGGVGMAATNIAAIRLQATPVVVGSAPSSPASSQRGSIDRTSLSTRRGRISHPSSASSSQLPTRRPSPVSAYRNYQQPAHQRENATGGSSATVPSFSDLNRIDTATRVYNILFPNDNNNNNTTNHNNRQTIHDGRPSPSPPIEDSLTYRGQEVSARLGHTLSSATPPDTPFSARSASPIRRHGNVPAPAPTADTTHRDRDRGAEALRSLRDLPPAERRAVAERELINAREARLLAYQRYARLIQSDRQRLLNRIPTPDDAEAVSQPADTPVRVRGQGQVQAQAQEQVHVQDAPLPSPTQLRARDELVAAQMRESRAVSAHEWVRSPLRMESQPPTLGDTSGLLSTARAISGNSGVGNRARARDRDRDRDGIDGRWADLRRRIIDADQRIDLLRAEMADASGGGGSARRDELRDNIVRGTGLGPRNEEPTQVDELVRVEQLQQRDSSQSQSPRYYGPASTTARVIPPATTTNATTRPRRGPPPDLQIVGLPRPNPSEAAEQATARVVNNDLELPVVTITAEMQNWGYDEPSPVQSVTLGPRRRGGRGASDITPSSPITANGNTNANADSSSNGPSSAQARFEQRRRERERERQRLRREMEEEVDVILNQPYRPHGRPRDRELDLQHDQGEAETASRHRGTATASRRDQDDASAPAPAPAPAPAITTDDRGMTESMTEAQLAQIAMAVRLIDPGTEGGQHTVTVDGVVVSGRPLSERVAALARVQPGIRVWANSDPSGEIGAAGTGTTTGDVEGEGEESSESEIESSEDDDGDEESEEDYIYSDDDDEEDESEDEVDDELSEVEQDQETSDADADTDSDSDSDLTVSRESRSDLPTPVPAPERNIRLPRRVDPSSLLSNLSAHPSPHLSPSTSRTNMSLPPIRLGPVPVSASTHSREPGSEPQLEAMVAPTLSPSDLNPIESVGSPCELENGGMDAHLWPGQSHAHTLDKAVTWGMGSGKGGRRERPYVSLLDL